MEVALLKTTKTYQQVERLLVSIPPGSTHLDLLPSVFPIDVPVQAFRISSPFGTRRHPIRRTIHFHNGLDLKAPLGMIVKATAAGIVS